MITRVSMRLGRRGHTDIPILKKKAGEECSGYVTLTSVDTVGQSSLITRAEINEMRLFMRKVKAELMTQTNWSFSHYSTKSWQVGARAPWIAGTPITQVDLRPTSTDSESTPENPQNPVRNRTDFVFGVGRESLGVVGCVGDEGVLRGG